MILILTLGSGPALADTDCNVSPNAPYCKAQLEQVRAQTQYTDDQRDELESKWHAIGTGIGVVAGAIAGIVALIGVVTGLFQLASTLKAAKDNIAVQRTNLELQRKNIDLQRGQIVDNQYLEVLKRLADPAPATRISAVPLLVDLSDGGDDEETVSVPPRFVAKQLAAILSTEDKLPVIDAIERGFISLCGAEPGRVLNADAASAVREALGNDYFAARRDDLAVALAEYDAYEAKQKGGLASKESARAVAGVSNEELYLLRSSDIYMETQNLASQDGYFNPDVRFGQLATALRASGKRLKVVQETRRFSGENP